MDAKIIRDISAAAEDERKKEMRKLTQRLEKERAEAIERGKIDGEGKVYKEILAKIKELVRINYHTHLDYDFSEDDRAYLESLLSSLAAKLIKEGFKIYSSPNIESHHYPAHYEMDYGHIDEGWRYTAKLRILW